MWNSFEQCMNDLQLKFAQEQRGFTSEKMVDWLKAGPDDEKQDIFKGFEYVSPVMLKRELGLDPKVLGPSGLLAPPPDTYFKAVGMLAPVDQAMAEKVMMSESQRGRTRQAEAIDKAVAVAAAAALTAAGAVTHEDSWDAHVKWEEASRKAAAFAASPEGQKYVGGGGGERGSDRGGSDPHPLASPPCRCCLSAFPLQFRPLTPARLDSIPSQVRRGEGEAPPRSSRHGSQPARRAAGGGGGRG